MADGNALLEFLRQEFEEADVDSSGELDPVELSCVLREAYKRQKNTTRSVKSIQAQVQSFMDIYDADGTGALSFEQFIALFCFHPAFRFELSSAEKDILKKKCNMDPELLALSEQAAAQEQQRANPPARRGGDGTRLKTLAAAIQQNQATVLIVTNALKTLPGGERAMDQWLRAFGFLDDPEQLRDDMFNTLSRAGGSIEEATAAIVSTLKAYQRPIHRDDIKARWNEVNDGNDDSVSLEEWVDFTQLLFELEKLNAGTQVLQSVMDLVRR